LCKAEATMADPLSLLRKFTIQGKEAKQEGDFIVFDDIKFHKSTETTFKKQRQGRYVLGDCWFFLQTANRDVKHRDYVQLATKEGFGFISLVDRRDLLAYLKGEIESSKKISEMPLVTPTGLSGSTEDTASKEKPIAEMKLSEELLEQKKAFQLRLEGREPVKATEAPTTTYLEIPGMSKAEIEAIRLKRRKIKTGRVKDDDEVKIVKDKGGFVEADVFITRDIVERERLLRDRGSVLQSKTKSFSDLLGVVSSIYAKEKDLQRGKGRGGPPPKKPQRPPQQQQKPSYNRYDVEEDQFWRTKMIDADGWKIDTRGTFAGPFGGLSVDSLKPSDDKREKEQNGKNKQKSTAKRPSSSTSSQRPSSRDRKRPRLNNQPRTSHTSRVPIIIVPSPMNSLITLYNVAEFLGDGEYYSSLEKKNNNGTKRTDFWRIKGTEKIRYKVTDNPTGFTANEWDRVVAVFALGVNWQFKKWMWEAPVDLFNKVQGFHLHFSGVEPPPLIKQWNVKRIHINKNKRHLDKTAMLEFWEILDKFIARKKPFLKY